MDNQLSAAGRLFRILKKFTSGRPNNNLTYDAWANVFGIPPEQRTLVLYGIAGVHRLVDEAKAEVQAHPELNQGLYLEAITNIENALAKANLDSSWDSTKISFEGANATALAFVAEQFDRLSAELVVPDDVLAHLRSELEAVIAEILASDLPLELRNLLISNLEDARQAIVFYQLDGIDGLRKAAESAIGAIVVAREARAASNKKPFLDYIKIVGDILDVVGKAKPYLSLLKPAVKALL